MVHHGPSEVHERIAWDVSGARDATSLEVCRITGIDPGFVRDLIDIEEQAGENVANIKQLTLGFVCLTSCRFLIIMKP